MKFEDGTRLSKIEFFIEDNVRKTIHTKIFVTKGEPAPKFVDIRVEVPRRRTWRERLFGIQESWDPEIATARIPTMPDHVHVATYAQGDAGWVIGAFRDAQDARDALDEQYVSNSAISYGPWETTAEGVLRRQSSKDSVLKVTLKVTKTALDNC